MHPIRTLKDLLSPYGNPESVTFMLCQKLEILVTKTTIQKQLEEHPDYTSLLSVSDVLKNIGIENIALKSDINSLNEFPTPFIAQIKVGYESLFCVVSNVENDSIKFYHPLEKKETTFSKAEFDKIFTGIVLLAEKSDTAGEKDYTTHLQEEKRLQLTKILSVAVVPILTIIACGICFAKNGIDSVWSILYAILTLAGTIVGTLLLWYEVDKYNAALQQICTGGSKTNCNAILSSTASKIFGISWSAIGFTYFAGSLISLLVSGIYNTSILFILFWLNVLAFPYILFSIYYQSRIAKQWCVLCLTVQVILALQFITALFGEFHIVDNLSNIQISSVATILVFFSIPFLVVSLLLPALRQAKENKQNKNELQRLKHNPQIFEALLVKQKTITEPTDGLGISLGNPNAKYKLVKVCNPYCGPCARAHPAIEELLENNTEVQVQILFTATDDEKDFKTPPVKHLLAINEKNNEQQTKQALDDWYLADKKDYEAFAAKYPMNGELKRQDDKINAMAEWCSKTEIAFTPTFFVNGYQLPEIYTVADLKYFLSV
ncbi:MAG: cysteine peptidase family C39 domain-containing protein [Arachidicoccus sp.]|nr:cysteine peptidase family C39 domain-containing protein [Arachidicoccus sp.]